MRDPRLSRMRGSIVLTERQYFGVRVKQCCNEIKSLPFLTQICDPPKLKVLPTFLRADLRDSWSEDTGNLLLVFPLPNYGCLILPPPPRIFMHVFMNDNTRLPVTYLSPSVCFTTTVTFHNEVLPCPMISQSSKDMLNLLPSPSVICSLTQYIYTKVTYQGWYVDLIIRIKAFSLVLGSITDS